MGSMKTCENTQHSGKVNIQSNFENSNSMIR